MKFFEFDDDFFGPAAPIARRGSGRLRGSAARRDLHQVELFLEELTGETTQRAAPPPPVAAPVAAAVKTPRGHAWARRVFDEMARQGAPPDGTVSGPFDGSRWTIVALPRSNTPAASVRPGDLVAKRALGEGRLVSLLVADATIQVRDLFGPDGLVRADTLVLRAGSGVDARPAPAPVEWEYADSDAEAVPTFAVGAADTVDPVPQYVELPAHVEDWVANAAGTGLVLSQFACRTPAELEAAIPGAGARIAVPGGSPRALWRTNPAGRLEALLEVLVFHPAPAAGGTTLPPGRHPLAIICHGNHNAVEAGVEVLSHQGYSGFMTGLPAVATGAYLQEALAERGIISASVNMNPANHLNLMVETRARLAIAALQKMDQLNRLAGSRYHRKIDFQRVALIGHSRGGDAVARATALIPANTRARAVVQLAPTDITGLLQGARPTAFARPPGTPVPTFATRPITIPAGAGRQLILWGSRDGDVSGFQDVRADVSVNPFRHYDRSSVERAFQFWHGATHNRFNRLWTDDYEDSGCLSRIAADPAGLLSRADQEARAVEMVRGWLLFSLYDETAEAGRFDGRTPTAVAPAQAISAMWKFGSRLATIDEFDDVRPGQNTLGGANVTPATGVFDEITIANENGAGAGQTAYQIPHIDRALRYSPAPGTGVPVRAPLWRTTIPPGVSRNFGRFDLLTFRVTKKYDPAWLNPPPAPPAPAPAPPTATLPTVRVRLIGPTPAVTHREAATGRLSSLPVLRLLPPIAGCDPRALDLTKVHYETWEVPLAPYAAAMGGIANVRFVEIEIDTQVGQPVYVDTVSLVKRP